MTGFEAIEKLSHKYSMTIDELLREGSSLMLKEKKHKLQNERLEIFSRYDVMSIQELENKIKEGEIREHPAWEDLIELRNIESEIMEIDSDIHSLHNHLSP